MFSINNNQIDYNKKNKIGKTMPNENTIRAKRYISDRHAFGNHSFYPESNLNALSISFLKKNPGKVEENQEKPNLNIDDLISEGMSKKKAQIALFLIQYRHLFDIATRGGDESIWESHPKEPSKRELKDKWKRNDFIDRIYVIAHWVFEEPNFSNKKLINAAHDLTEIVKVHLSEEYSAQYKVAIDTVNEGISSLNKMINAIPTIDSIKEHFKDNKKIINIINRFEEGAKSNNPYWYKSKEKLNRICNCLADCIENNDDIDLVLKDKSSALSQAIDMRRLPGFFSKDTITESRNISQNETNIDRPKNT
jgi:bacterioferritin (cytochrome b1)